MTKVLKFIVPGKMQPRNSCSNTVDRYIAGSTVRLITRWYTGVRIVSVRGGGACDNWAPVTR